MRSPVRPVSRTTRSALAEPATKAVRTADGSVWVEMGHGEATSVARILASGEAVVGAAPKARLSGVGWIGERPAVAIVDADESHAWRGDSDAYGAVLVEFTDGTQVDVAPAGGPEYGVGSATIGDGRVLVGAFSDLAEVFRSFDIDGNELSGVFSTDRCALQRPAAVPLAGGRRRRVRLDVADAGSRDRTPTA